MAAASGSFTVARIFPKVLADPMVVAPITGTYRSFAGAGGLQYGYN